MARQKYSISLSALTAATVLLFPVPGITQDAAPVEPAATFAEPSATFAEPSATFAEDEVNRAVQRGITYLLSQQQEDGSIRDKGHDTTMTALSIMAMASVGVQPVDPTPEGKAMREALAFVLRDDRVDDKGYFGRKDGSRMYGHGIVTLMLTEMLGMGVSEDQDRLLHDRCQKAIDVILSAQQVRKSQADEGGWRYEPGSNDSDLSVSVWQVMALRSAYNDGLDVPPSAIADAVEYLRRSYSVPGDSLPADAEPGGFTYEPHGGNPAFAMTAAGLLAMQVCGQYDDPRVRGAADWLLTRPPEWKDRFCTYGTYYYAQGMYQRGGEHAETARKEVRDLLLEKQQENGAWTAQNGSENNIGPVYTTALSILTLSVKYHFLPIYQK